VSRAALARAAVSRRSGWRGEEAWGSVMRGFRVGR